MSNFLDEEKLCIYNFMVEVYERKNVHSFLIIVLAITLSIL